MKAGYLFKQNIEALLRARHQTRHDLAFFCGRSDPWLSKILGKDNRNLPLKYLDLIADFFGIAAYQLFQPGISPLAERRKLSDRRQGKDRRRASGIPGQTTLYSARDIHLTPEDVALMLNIRSLSRRDRAELEKLAREAGRLLKRRKKSAPNGVPSVADEWSTEAPDAPTHAGPAAAKTQP